MPFFLPTQKKENKQTGNVLFLILIAVALFAALSYAVTSTTNYAGIGKVDEETARVQVAEIFSFYTNVRMGILRIVASGIDPTNINFEKFDTTEYGVFSPNGGGITYYNPPNDLNVSEWGFASTLHATAGIYVTDIASNADITGRDIIGGLTGISLELCEAINKELGLPSPPATNSATASPFAASYSIGNNVIDAYPGKSQGCFISDGGSGTYVYYITLFEN